MKSNFKRQLSARLILVNFAIFVLCLIAIEISLSQFSPIYLKGYNLQYPDNALDYGWGYFPKNKFQIFNPDTGERIYERVNNNGWRDQNRSFKNKKKAYRILILGDSETFGAIVKYEDRYASILEKKLLKDYNVEVITLADGGWGTDQQLEALKKVGLKFKANLVISQFNKNDLGDNAYYFPKLKFDQCATELKPQFGYKPSYYMLDSDCQMNQFEDPKFLTTTIKKNDKLFKKVIFKSEILKRVYNAYLNKKNNHTKKYLNVDPHNPTYKVKALQIKHLSEVLKADSIDYLLDLLEPHKNKFIGLSELKGMIKEANQSSNSDIILTILKHKLFKINWKIETYHASPIDTSTYKWQLYFRLIEATKQLTQTNDADLAIIASNELEYYKWMRHWYWINPSDSAKNNALQHIDVLRNKATEINADFIENTQPYERAINDPHMNANGNAAMADDIYKYLISKKKKELELFKKPSISP